MKKNLNKEIVSESAARVFGTISAIIIYLIYLSFGFEFSKVLFIVWGLFSIFFTIETILVIMIVWDAIKKLQCLF